MVAWLHVAVMASGAGPTKNSCGLFTPHVPIPQRAVCTYFVAVCMRLQTKSVSPLRHIKLQAVARSLPHLLCMHVNFNGLHLLRIHVDTGQLLLLSTLTYNVLGGLPCMRAYQA